MRPAPPDITQLLGRVRAGEAEAEDELARAVYDQLVELAHGQRLRWGPKAAAGTRTLAHEVFMRLHGARPGASSGLDFESRRHYFAVASRAMRNLLIDRARQRLSAKRQPLEADVIPALDAERLLMLDDCLARLGAVDERLSKVVEYRVFGGLEHGELAEQLGVSERSARRLWMRARVWLERELSNSGVDAAVLAGESG